MPPIVIPCRSEPKRLIRWLTTSETEPTLRARPWQGDLPGRVTPSGAQPTPETGRLLGAEEGKQVMAETPEQLRIEHSKKCQYDLSKKVLYS